MADDKTPQNPAPTEGRVTIDAPMNTPAAPTNDATPDSLGVSQAQFDKFYDKDKAAYNWEGHAKELAWQQSQKGQQPPKADAAPADPPAEATDDEANKAIQAAGLNMADLNAELAADGKLSNESIKALEAVGIPADVAQDYSQFVLGQAKSHIEKVHAELGGEAGLKQLKAWAEKNMTQAERQKYEAGLTDPTTWKVFADSLKARAGLREGNPSQIVNGGNAQGGQNNSKPGFASMAEQSAAQRDPRYRTDPAYRAEVVDRTRRSNYDVSRRHAITN